MCYKRLCERCWLQLRFPLYRQNIPDRVICRCVISLGSIPLLRILWIIPWGREKVSGDFPPSQCRNLVDRTALVLSTLNQLQLRFCNCPRGDCKFWMVSELFPEVWLAVPERCVHNPTQLVCHVQMIGRK